MPTKLLTRISARILRRRRAAQVSGPDADDYCQMEFEYARSRLGRARMLPACLDRDAADQRGWAGPVGMVAAPPPRRRPAALSQGPPSDSPAALFLSRPRGPAHPDPAHRAH